tara:strand:- start:483 stop:881 length:399 start_codon:yes stop_codon:yes gene_type:complete
MRPLRINTALITAAITGGALAASAILPHGGVDGLKLCPWYHLSGHPCPFCGMTRAFVAITHFDVQAAIDFNLGSPLIYGAFLYMFWASISALRKGEERPTPPKKALYNSWITATITIFAWLFYQRILRLIFF